MTTQNSTGLDRYLPLAGRVLIAIIFVLSGVMKIAAPGDTIGYIAAMHLPYPEIGLIISVIVELGGGVLLVVGYQTKLVALVLALFCIVTAMIFHSNFGDQAQMVNFLKNLAMAGGLLHVAVYGGGALSLDARRG